MMFISAWRKPRAEVGGANSTVIVCLALAAIVIGKVAPTREKSAASVPEKLIPVTSRAAGPAFSISKVLVVVLPLITLPKSVLLLAEGFMLPLGMLLLLPTRSI